MKSYPVVKRNGKPVVIINDGPVPAAPAEIKPGKKTTEGAAALIGQISALAMAFGVITPDQAATIDAESTQIIGQIGAVLIPSLWIVARSALKIFATWRGRA